ncbi:MAG: ATP-dependent helicase, partial [Curvibacter sp.]
AVTFTNKAAHEMRHRIAATLGVETRGLWVGTFHGIAHRLLRLHWQDAGLPEGFQILDADDQLRLVKRVIADLDLDDSRFPPRQVVWWINARKDEGQRPEHIQIAGGDYMGQQMLRAYAEYEVRCRRAGLVDFAEILLRAHETLRDHPALLAHYQRRFTHLLVDEFQDTNAIQYAFVRLLAGERGQVFIVGDDDQAIYGWRGATLDNLKKLPVDFPNLKVIKLEQNYRSTGAILQAANNVIGPNPKLFPKRLWSELGDGEPVRVVDADNEEHEAERVVARIQSLRAGNTLLSAQGAAAPGRPKQGTAPSGGSEPHAVGSVGAQFKDFAVLYRANHQAKVLEQALRKAQIPYKVSGGTSFFDRAEIRDLCAWFRLWVNNDDDPAFLRAVTTPKRGIGHQTLQSLGTFASQYKVSLFEALFSSSLGSVLNARAVGSLHEFGRYVNDLEYRARHTLGIEDALAFMRDWLKDIGYEKHLYDSEDNERLAAARWTNVMEFCDWMAKRCGGEIDDTAGVTLASEQKSLLEVAQTVSLLSTITEREQDQNVVTLSTLHAAKGLEWPHVMLVGVTEGMLPFKLDEGGDSSGGSQCEHEAANESVALRLQEERRLMYVGITRAQRSLAVSWPKRKKKGREMVSAQPSRFIAEMALDRATVKEDPREKLRALRAEFAKKAQEAAAAQALARGSA